MILVPIKMLVGAKQRLANILSSEERLALARAMCLDVLQTLANWRSRPPVALVTTDSFARDLAGRFDFEVIADNNAGESSAIELATEECKARGFKSTLILPADIPLIEIAELEKIISAAPPAGTLLVPDAAGRGTNAAFRSPADLFPLRFGNDSYLPHFAAAKATGLPCVVLQLQGIARDIDRPEDLLEVAAARGDRQSQKLIRSWNLSSRTAVGQSSVSI
jgi:2-phospho-L-lactate guanylyltransferase